MKKAKNGVSNHPTDQRRCGLKNLGALFYKFPLLRCWFGSAFLCTVFVRRARSLLFEVHDSLGALCQSLWLPLEGLEQQQSIPGMLGGSGHSWLMARARWLQGWFAVRTGTAVTAAVQWHFGALWDMNWLPSPLLLGGNIVNDLYLCFQRKVLQNEKAFN